MNNKEPLKIANYCVSFIDLLGQRLEYKDQSTLPKFNSAEEREQFLEKLRNTIGAIDELQRDSDSFLNTALSHQSPLREQLQPDLKPLYDEMREVHFKRQRWSDGLVYFISLADGNVKCSMVGVYFLLIATGSLCFFGLAKKRPMRGAIDIAWATELLEGELYGAAVARAYELENQVAQYPRIVVGPKAVDYLIDNMKNPASDIYSKFNQSLAKTCYSMLTQDSDGYHFVHYLGDVFYKNVSMKTHQELYQHSIQFVLEQCEKWKGERNTKLSLRYSHLLSYFLAHPPSGSQEENTRSGAA